MRAAAMMREPLPVAVEGDAVQLHSVVDEAEPQLLGDPLLKRLKLVVDEFDDFTGLHINQVIVMFVRRRFIARAAIPELMPSENAGLFEQANGTVDRRDRNPGIDS